MAEVTGRVVQVMGGVVDVDFSKYDIVPCLSILRRRQNVLQTNLVFSDPVGGQVRVELLRGRHASAR